MSSKNNSNSDNYKIKTFIDNDVIKEAFKDAAANSSSSGPNDSNIKLIGSIDQGTSSTRFILFAIFANQIKILAYSQKEFEQIYPSDHIGWHEHNPFDIWNSVVDCIDTLSKELLSSREKISIHDCLVGIGITNQRETIVSWNEHTGKLYYNAIVWDDVRTMDIATKLSNDNEANKALFHKKTGLPISSYFSGTKMKWLLDNVSELQNDIKDPEMSKYVRFGTIDTWLVYQLTGEKRQQSAENNNIMNGDISNNTVNNNGLYITDVTNASRWLFLDISTKKWDKQLIDIICYPHGNDIPFESCLPKIRSSSEIYGYVSKDCGISSECSLDGIPIGSILGDQQAALFGQCGYNVGDIKCTYGTGLFLMMNIGTTNPPKLSSNGLLTTIAYQIKNNNNKDDDDDQNNDVITCYAMEGSVSHSGSTIQWLRDKLQIINDASETEDYANSELKSNDDLYFVPAFSGLYAPYWNNTARGCIVGMTASHNKSHIIRAALESITYQTKELINCILNDFTTTSTANTNSTSNNSDMKLLLKVDGGATNNNFLMQYQADILDLDVIKPQIMETTALGVAYATGLALGIWNNIDEIRKFWKEDCTYKPNSLNMTSDQRNKYWHGWKKAINKSIGWIDDNNIDTNANDDSDDNDNDDGYETAVTEEGDLEILASEDETAKENITTTMEKEDEKKAVAAATTNNDNSNSNNSNNLTFLMILTITTTIISGTIGFMLGSNRKQQTKK